MSVPLDVNVMSDGANLQKAASLSRAELEARLQRPKFVPEKLNFQLYEKFEGKFLCLVLEKIVISVPLVVISGFLYTHLLCLFPFSLRQSLNHYPPLLLLLL